jgi:uncharacterized protein (TIGR02594 family)
MSGSDNAMPDSVPNWLAVMRQLDGTEWAPSDGPSAKIKNWLSYIGGQYPNTAAYCSAAATEDYFSWCGLTVGYCMAESGMAPMFGATAVTQFLFATSWLGWGTPVTTPQLGDVLIFDFGGGDHHVTLFEKDNGNGTFGCHGGNQSHEVNVTNFPKSSLMGIRRPNTAANTQQFAAGTLLPGSEGRAVTALQTALAAQGFDPGGIDGAFGPLTSSAVSSFQRSRNLSVTGVADPATLQALGLSIDGPQPSVAAAVAAVQAQDVIKPLVDALVAKQQIAPAQRPAAAYAAKPAAAPAATGSGSSAGAGTTAPAVLSVIDQIFGGQALAGKKTMLAIIAYVILAILQATGKIGNATGPDATPAGEILTTLIAAFGALGGVAKVDRLTQTLGQAANQSANQSTPPEA